MPERTTKPRVYVHAFFCESVIREMTTDRLTAVRIASGFVSNPLKIAPNLPDGTVDEKLARVVYLPVHVTAVISFYCEQATEFMITLKAIHPSGGEMETTAEPIPCTLRGGDAGHTLNTDIRINPEENGVHWLEVYVDGELATKTPFHIRRAPMIAGGSSYQLTPPHDPESVPPKAPERQTSE